MRGLVSSLMLAPLLGGCVAAALPLAAGTALLTTRSGKGRPVATTPPAASAPSAASASSASSAVRPPSPAMPVAGVRATLTTLTELPAPANAGLADTDLPVARFGRYALERAAAPATGKRASVVLAAASMLATTRAPCRASAPAVFVDLDPGRGTFDPLAPGLPHRTLASHLAALRDAGITVVWFSRLGENFAAPARAALAASGFDPHGRDPLVLLRSLDERKQSRRDEAAASWCPIAMLGDERADFDELYLYLKNPGAAATLDRLLDDGWFLASPFAADPAPASMTKGTIQ